MPRSRKRSRRSQPRSVKATPTANIESASSRNYRSQKRTTLRYRYRIKGPTFPVKTYNLNDEETV